MRLSIAALLIVFLTNQAFAMTPERDLSMRAVATAIILAGKCHARKVDIFAVTMSLGDVSGPALTQRVDEANAALKNVSDTCEVFDDLFGPKGALAPGWKK